MIHFRLRYERLRDRLRQVSRGVVLARSALVGVAVAGAGAVATALRPEGPWERWLPGAAIAAVVAALWLERRARRSAVDVLLDRRFALDDLIVTAVEVDRRGPRNALEVRLLDDAAATLAGLGGERAVSWRPVAIELEQLAGACCLVLGLVLLAHVRGRPSLPERLPDVPGLFGPGGIGVAGVGAGPGVGAGRGDGPSAAQRAVAEALGDQAAAGDVARALHRGDEAGAARALRALADVAPGMSDSGRDGLEDAFEDASERTTPLDPTLGRALRDVARELASPDTARGRNALEALAARVDGGAGRAIATSQLAAPEAGGRAARLPIDPEAGGLERSPAGTVGRRAAGRPEGDASAELLPAGGVAGSGAKGGQHGDPSGLPIADQALVRRYFAPRPARPAPPDDDARVPAP